MATPLFPAVFRLPDVDGTDGFKLLLGPRVAGGGGEPVAPAGDLNGDGFADFIVGAPFLPDGQGAYEGGAYVVFGKASGIPRELRASSLDGTNGFAFHSSPTAAYMGDIVSAGDFNGDGVGDLILGAVDPTSQNWSTKLAYVVFGHTGTYAAGVSPATLNGADGFRLDLGQSNLARVGLASAGDLNGDGIDDMVAVGATTSVVFGARSGFPAQMDVSGLNGSNGFHIVAGPGARVGYSLGYSAAAAGDVNGDGIGDLILGAPLADAGTGPPNDPNSPRPGAAFVVFGQASGFPSSLDVNSLDGTNGFRINGARPYDMAGATVASAGDINGDGFSDVVISNGYGSYGNTYVVFGKGSGMPAVVDAAALDGSNGFRISSEDPISLTGFSVASAGDINGDGFDDLIIGAPRLDPTGLRTGAAYVVYGKASGFAANLDLSSLDGSDGFKLVGAQYDHAGMSVASAGDINGDGLDDLLVSAAYTGRVYVVYGRLPGAAVTRIGTDASQTLVGGAFGDVLSGRGGNDRLYGHGGTDRIDGGPGDDTAVYFGPLSAYQITTDAHGVTTVRDLRPGSPDGTDRLVNVEHLQFVDQTIATPPPPANQAPTAGPDSLSTGFGAPVTVSVASLLANDFDPDGDVLSLTAVGAVQHGVAALNGNQVTFTPAAGFSGIASFSYTLSDGHGGLASGQVSVNVGPAPPGLPAYIYHAGSSAPETIDLTGDGAYHAVVAGAGDTTVLTGSGGSSVKLGAGTDVVIGGSSKDVITFGSGLGTVTGGAGPDTFIFVKGQIADPAAHGGQFDTVMDFTGAGSAYAAGRDFIYLQGFPNAASVIYEHDLAGDPAAHLYRIDDGAYHAEFVLEYSGPGVNLNHSQYGFL